MSARIRSYIEHYTPLIDAALHRNLPVSRVRGTEHLNQAVCYAVFSGGRRMRPILVLLAAEICGARAESALPAACAIEFLHAASLAIDDLPCMDDAGMRRGLATVHKVFGDDVALLAALALLNQAYTIFAAQPDLLSRALREIGVNGMIGGQAADVCSVRSCRPLAGGDPLEKTTALTRLTMASGAASAGAGEQDANVLIAYGEAVGEAYQICDDIADALATDGEAGKPAHQDLRHGRSNLVSRSGCIAATHRVGRLIDDAVTRLRMHFGDGETTDLLEDFARSIVARGMNLVKYDSASDVSGVHRARRVERDTMAGGAGA